MRITMQSIHRNILGNLNKINEDMNRINMQISSGKQISKISQDPVNLVTALGLRTNLTQISQYQTNLKFGDKTIIAAENSLSQMKDLASRARVLSLQAANAPMTPENRQNMEEEVKHLFESAITLANTSVNGKYIFGGYRTTGYSDVEPMPFIQDARDGYFINGSPQSRMEEKLTGTVGATDLLAGDLLLNGVDIGAVDLDAGLNNGLNMDGASQLKAAINVPATGVTASLTTQTYSSAATGDATGDGSVAFYLNGQLVGVGVTNGDLAADTNAALVAAINAKTELTGVLADIGDGTNGAAADTLILKNTTAGDESAITITSFTNTAAGTGITFVDGSQAADATHNTGQISLSSTASFSITTNAVDDTILNRIGLGGGNKGFLDQTGDGLLTYGSAIGNGNLKINGIEVTTQADLVSTIYKDISAAAKAAAVNSSTDQHGVSAQVVPASLTAAAAVAAGTESTKLTGLVGNSLAINAGDLTINGVATSALALVGAPSNGLNMSRTSGFKDVVNAISATTGVSANLTTLSAGGAANAGAGNAAISFTLNGVAVSFNANGADARTVAQQSVEAINAVSGETGVTAVLGNGNNGGPLNSIVLHNSLPGDERAIVLADLDAAETARIGLADGSQAADATHNTGAITFSSEAAFTLASPNNLIDDNILQEFSLDSGEVLTGISGDLADDGTLTYGSTPAYLGTGDLTINGIDIFAKTTAITEKDGSNALIKAINAKQDETGVIAGRNNAGQLILTAVDGRNIHIQTSALGEKVSKINGGNPQANSKVYFGEIRLSAGREFFLESDTTTVGALTKEAGFEALGLAGGEASTGISGDTAADGKLFVNKIHYENGSVRYAGDRDNDFAIKVGAKSEMKVAENGESSIMDTGIFTILNNLRHYLEGDSYKTLNGAAQATDTTALLDSGKTGLPLAGELKNGSFAISVNRHDTSPPTTSAVSISIDLTKDSLEDIAERINGVPGLSASWSGEGYLQINSDDPNRYTFNLGSDTSNFLRVVGADAENMQASNLSAAVGDLDRVMQNLTDQISDFGARSNRIIVQQQIYSNLELATQENLSEREDTDMFKAVMELKAKEVAYQAALSSAAKTMQMSLVDFLK